MKRVLMIFISLFITSYSLNAQTNTFVNSIINEVSIDSLNKFVRILSGEQSVTLNGTEVTILSRNANYETNDIAADYIQMKLESYGFTVTNQLFNSEGRNVIAEKMGINSPFKYYMICAHYDSMPSSTFSPGADDNASGTAAVIEAARLLKDYNLASSVIFALWDEEEYGLIGSNYYAQQASLISKNISGVINLDMIAWDENDDGDFDIHIRDYGNTYDIADKVVEVNTLYSIGLNPNKRFNGATASDHASFWSYDYGAVLLIEDYYGNDFNNYYHTQSDQIEEFNFDYFEKMSKVAIGTLASLTEVLSPLPVELTAFNAEMISNYVELNWETASELNNRGFEIERSVEKNRWDIIGFVEGNSTTSESNRYYFIDNLPLEGKNYYRLKQIDMDGTFSYSSVVEVEYIPAYKYALQQNYPNPFNPSTNINYSLASDEYISLKVYDMLGREVRSLVDEYQSKGTYKVVFDSQNLPSGFYIYKLQTGSFAQTRKMMLLR